MTVAAPPSPPRDEHEAAAWVGHVALGGRYTYCRQRWYAWTGRAWRRADRDEVIGAVRRACHAYYDSQTTARPHHARRLNYLLDGNWHRRVLEALRAAVAVPTVGQSA